jgi:hypothetical protein
VFVLGAGVSASCGIPVTKDIFVRVMQRLSKKRPQQFKELTSLLRYLHPTFRTVDENYPNLEDSLAQVEMARRFNSREFVTSTLWPSARLQQADETLKRALAGYLWRFTAKATSVPVRPVVEFCERILRPSDVVVTFNWDLTIERSNSLLDGGRGSYDLQYSYKPTAPDRRKQRRSLTVLKPHGSIDWFTKAQVRSVKAAGPNDFFRIGPDLFTYNHFRMLRHHRLSSRAPIIVAPSPFKEFKVRALREIWCGVFRSLRHADSIHIIGYSLPREDQFARFIFRRAFRLVTRDGRNPQITVVNPDGRVRETFAQTIGPELPLVFKQMTFGRWLETTESGRVTS